MATDTLKGLDEFFCEFKGDVIPDEFATSNDTGTISVGTPTDASCLRLNNSAAGNNEMCEVDEGATTLKPSNGHVFFEARIRLEAATTVAANIGLLDVTLEDNNTLPVELSGTTFTSNAATWIGFVADTNATNDYWHIFWVDDNVDCSTAIASLKTNVPIAALKWLTARIDIYDNGSGNQCRTDFSIADEDGHNWQYSASSTVDRDVPLNPHIGIENRTTTARYLDIDYWSSGQSRCSTGS